MHDWILVEAELPEPIPEPCPARPLHRGTRPRPPGRVGDLADFLTDQVGDNYGAAAQALLVGSAFLSGIVDNIPYVATMAPLVNDLIGPGAGAGPHQQWLWWFLALGADLVGNATAIGASANVVVTGIAKRNGHPLSFWTFTRYSLIVTAVTIGLRIPSGKRRNRAAAGKKQDDRGTYGHG